MSEIFIKIWEKKFSSKFFNVFLLGITPLTPLQVTPLKPFLYGEICPQAPGSLLLLVNVSGSGPISVFSIVNIFCSNFWFHRRFLVILNIFCYFDPLWRMKKKFRNFQLETHNFKKKTFKFNSLFLESFFFLSFLDS